MKCRYITFISLLALFCLAGHPANATKNIRLAISPEKVITIKLIDTGIITAGRDTISSDDLARYIQDRLFKSFKGTGEMPAKIKLEKMNSDIPEMIVDIVQKEIQGGQQRALTDLCLLKYKRLFDAIGKRQQDKLKRQFPVLFQTDYQ